MSSQKPKISFREITLFAWSYIKNYPWRIIIIVMGLFVMASMELVRPVIAGLLVDFLTQHMSAPAEAVPEAMIYVAWYMGTGVIYWLFMHGSWFIWAQLVSQGMRRILEDSLYKVQRFSTHWHESSFAGSTVTKIKRGMRGFQDFIDLFYYKFIPLTLVSIGMVIIISSKYLWLGVLIGVGMILYAFFSIRIALKYVMPATLISNKHDNRVGASLADTITCNTTVKSFANEDREDKLFHKVAKKFQQTSLVSWTRNTYLNIGQNSLMTVFKFLFIASAVVLWSQNIFSIGDFVFVLASYDVISSHLRQIGDEIRRMQMAASDMEDIVIFSQMSSPIQEKPNATNLKVQKGEITFDNVNFTYNGSKEAIFKNLSITIQPGEKIALVGHSGGGKSTFIKLLQRLYDIQKGSILIDGQKINNVTLTSLRKSIMLIPQEPLLFHRSLSDNIAYGRPTSSYQKIITAAKMAHAHEFIQRSPQKYDTYVGERGVKLSGGERQRVAIARAILADRPILILDEATSNLDSVSEKYIQDAMEKLMEKRTTIIVAHRLSTIKKADRIIVFERGKIVEEGTHNTLLKKTNGHYKKLYDMQVGGFIS